MWESCCDIRFDHFLFFRFALKSDENTAFFDCFGFLVEELFFVSLEETKNFVSNVKLFRKFQFSCSSVEVAEVSK
jgi:hypothetical protein